jgi:spermidine synthase
MDTYVEIDGAIQRVYELEKSTVGLVKKSKCFLEIVSTVEFGDSFFLDGELQMTKQDEYIYHEMLVHPAMLTQSKAVDVCILGGGDGCAAREALKWKTVKSIDIFDWDEEVVRLFEDEYKRWNHGALNDERVNIHIQNVLDIPFTKTYDIIVIDLVDPDYTKEDSRELWSCLIPRLPALMNKTTAIVINAGGIYPWRTKNVEWLQLLIANTFKNNIHHTLEAYKTFIPSFAYEWCFLFIRPIYGFFQVETIEQKIETRYFNAVSWKHATSWTKDYVGTLATERIKLRGYLPPL